MVDDGDGLLMGRGRGGGGVGRGGGGGKGRVTFVLRGGEVFDGNDVGVERGGVGEWRRGGGTVVGGGGRRRGSGGDGEDRRLQLALLQKLQRLHLNDPMHRNEEDREDSKEAGEGVERRGTREGKKERGREAEGGSQVGEGEGFAQRRGRSATKAQGSEGRVEGGGRRGEERGRGWTHVPRGLFDWRLCTSFRSSTSHPSLPPLPSVPSLISSWQCHLLSAVARLIFPCSSLPFAGCPCRRPPPLPLPLPPPSLVEGLLPLLPLLLPRSILRSFISTVNSAAILHWGEQCLPCTRRGFLMRSPYPPLLPPLSSRPPTSFTCRRFARPIARWRVD